jgi:tetratricopeptide (TPR) repeat protein
MIVSYLEKIDTMLELTTELNQQIKVGKHAFQENNFEIAIKSFSKALSIANETKPPLKSIIGISRAYLALIDSHKSVRDDTLEKVYASIDYFPEKPSNPLAYVSILMDIGFGFQKISLYECSIIILKKALDIAKNQVLEDNLEDISIVSRILAYSYFKVGNSSSAAKLFRIAADLSDKPTVAIDLYRNSAYLYYQVERKEDALNILQTAFDKAGIIEDFTAQRKIASFQGIISFEIFNYYYQKNYFDTSLEYLDLALQKFESINDEFWIIKLLYDKAMVYERMDKIWQRNKILKTISHNKLNKENEEFIIKAILLLTVHELEGDHHPQAEYYLRQIPSSKYEQLNPALKQKIHELNNVLEKSWERAQLRSGLKFSRVDLDLPVEELVPEEKATLESLVGEKEPIFEIEDSSLIAGGISDIQATSESDIPMQDLFTDIKSSSSIITSLEEIRSGSSETSVSIPTSLKNLKAPSIEVLHDLFKSSGEIHERTSKQDPTKAVIQSEISEEAQREPASPISPITPQSIVEQENTLALERLFTAHQQPEEPLSHIYSEQINEEIPISPQVSRQESVTTLNTQEIVHDPSTISRQLQKAGWTVQLNFASNTRRGAEPDIIAEKGLIRKSKKLIFFAENPTDAEICSFLLQTNPESGEKVIFLLRGDPRDANISFGIKIVTQINQLF